MQVGNDANALTFGKIRAIEPPNQAALMKSANEEAQLADLTIVTTQEEHELAVVEMRNIKGRLDALETMRTAITGPLNQALNATNAIFRVPRETLENALNVLKGKCLDWKRAEDKKAAEEQARAAEATRIERDRLAAAGAPHLAAIVTAPVVSSGYRKTSGAAVRKMLTYRIDKPIDVLRHIVENHEKEPHLVTLVSFEAKPIRALLSLHGEALAIPGISVVEVESMAVRA